MSFAARLCAFVVIILVCWWNTTGEDLTPLALRQFEDSPAVPELIQQATLAENFRPVVWLALVLALGGAMFWDEIKRWRKFSAEDHSCEKSQSCL